MDGLQREMEEIFSSCETDGYDKIKASNVIEVCRLNYNLNDEQKETLLNKLDPENIDMAYSKEDLFILFKDWIMCNKLSNEPKFSFAPVDDTSTPISSWLRRHYKKKIFLPQALFNEELLLSADEVDAEGSVRGSTHSSSQRLRFQKSRLESTLETSERYASSLERRYESMTNLYEKLKVENERLKQELKEYRDTEQTMKEVNEQMILVQKETYAKFVADISSMKAHLDNLENAVENLNRDLSSSEEKITKLELEKAYLIKRNGELEQYIIEKDKNIENMSYEMNTLKENTLEQRQAVSALIEENFSLKSELDEMKANAPTFAREMSEVMNTTPCHILNMGIPLCEELPSEMCIALPDESNLSDSVFLPFKERTCEQCRIREPVSLVSTVTQTDELLIQRKSLGCQIGAQLVSSECLTSGTHKWERALVSSQCPTELFMAAESVIDASIQLVSTECQANITPHLVSSECQTDIRTQLVSVECQTNALEHSVSSECQTNVPALLVSSECQTNFEGTLYQTNVPLKLVSTECQTTNISKQLNTSANHGRFLNVTLSRWIKFLFRLILNKFLDALGLLFIFLVFCTLLFYLFVIVCHNNQCVPQLRYSKPPPV